MNHVENRTPPSCSAVWKRNIAYMLGLSCSSGNGTNIKTLMPCSTKCGPWDNIWKFPRSLEAPFNIIIIATTTTICLPGDGDLKLPGLTSVQLVRYSGHMSAEDEYNSIKFWSFALAPLPGPHGVATCVCILLHLDSEGMGVQTSQLPTRRSLWNGMDFSRSQPRQWRRSLH